MKIKFNVEISQKDGFKENHLNFNGDADISIEELKELFNTKEDARPEEPVVDITPEQDDNTNTNGEKARFTVIICPSSEFYYVRYNNDIPEYYFMTPSIIDKKSMLKRKVDVTDFDNAAKYVGVPYDTNELDFLGGRKIKEV